MWKLHAVKCKLCLWIQYTDNRNCLVPGSCSGEECAPAGWQGATLHEARMFCDSYFWREWVGQIYWHDGYRPMVAFWIHLLGLRSGGNLDPGAREEGNINKTMVTVLWYSVVAL